MMGIFKASCSVFWLVWMLTLSFLFGVVHMETRYTYLNNRDPLGIMMMAACITIIVMAFLGCCCIKCDITHICCAIWYIIPTIVGTIGLCTFMIILIRSQDGGANLDEGDVLQMIIDEWNLKKQIPRFLQLSQAHYSCCGVFGFKDYRAFIITNATQQDVPFTCCVDLVEGLEDRCPPFTTDPLGGTTMENLFDKTEMAKLKLPFTLPRKSNGKIDDVKLDDMAFEIYGDKVQPGAWNWKDPGNSSLKLPPSKNLDKLKPILVQGCYDELKKNSELVIGAYMFFSIFLIVCAIVMSILYVQNGFKARRAHHESIKDLMLESAVKARTQVNSVVDEVEADMAGEMKELNRKAVLDGLRRARKKFAAARFNMASPGVNDAYPPGGAGGRMPSGMMSAMMSKRGTMAT